ncbi:MULTISPECIES: oligopeptide/dipeptide ABC transporter ATP-binding protein [unclassified Paracoccus (in: a-proteobacteria)]|uniref:oligopeptide/dipeptide ABC transporter ATP-binding protein n=1 Tax=unclassified Paracoccus (in: a-proteobacteria) TaxID=2688777 RepID=UPI001F15ADA3|nr:oligopeptide/dipeptide ABC transporter ATP-binding protein [Paracoccus sp. MC1862]
METNKVARLFEAPKHPYTRGLFDAIPELDAGRARLVPIEGTVPDPRNLPQGCAFAPRCARATDFCAAYVPELKPQAEGGEVACFHPKVTIAARQPQAVVA